MVFKQAVLLLALAVPARTFSLVFPSSTVNEGDRMDIQWTREGGDPVSFGIGQRDAQTQEPIDITGVDNSEQMSGTQRVRFHQAGQVMVFVTRELALDSASDFSPFNDGREITVLEDLQAETGSIKSNDAAGPSSVTTSDRPISSTSPTRTISGAIIVGNTIVLNSPTVTISDTSIIGDTTISSSPTSSGRSTTETTISLATGAPTTSLSTRPGSLPTSGLPDWTLSSPSATLQTSRPFEASPTSVPILPSPTESSQSSSGLTQSKRSVIIAMAVLAVLLILTVAIYLLYQRRKRSMQRRMAHLRHYVQRRWVGSMTTTNESVFSDPTARYTREKPQTRKFVGEDREAGELRRITGGMAASRFSDSREE